MATKTKENPAPAARKRAAKEIKNAETRGLKFEKLLREDPDMAYEELVCTAGQFAFEMLLQGCDEKELLIVRDFIKLMAESRRNAISKNRAELGREKWEFDAARICLLHLAQLQATMKDDSLDEEARVAQARYILFGIPLEKGIETDAVRVEKTPG